MLVIPSFYTNLTNANEEHSIRMEGSGPAIYTLLHIEVFPPTTSLAHALIQVGSFFHLVAPPQPDLTREKGLTTSKMAVFEREYGQITCQQREEKRKFTFSSTTRSI